MYIIYWNDDIYLCILTAAAMEILHRGMYKRDVRSNVETVNKLFIKEGRYGVNLPYGRVRYAANIYKT